DEEGQAPYYRVNLRKKSIKQKDNKPASYVEVKNGRMEDVDPDTVGNGSIANVRIFQYEYTKKGTSSVGTATVLMGIQVIKHVIAKIKPREDEFGEVPMETIDPDAVEGEEAFKPEP